MTSFLSALKSKRLVHRLLVGTPWRGVYPSFASAQAEIPQGKSIGYNSQDAADIFRTYPIYRKRVTDYVSTFHLRDLLHPGARLFDYGGSVGIAYYVYKQYLPLPANTEWLVCDVPAIVEVGRERAAEQPSEGLRFTSNFQDAEGFDILHSAGTLQFIETPLAQLLSQLKDLPPYLIINRIPVWESEPIWTVHTIGTFMCPYQVLNRQQFIDSLAALGYRLVDNWDCPESSLSIRFKPKLRLGAYQGFYFALDSHPVPTIREPEHSVTVEKTEAESDE